MGIEAILRTRIVNPKPDAQDNPRNPHQHDKSARRHGHDGEDRPAEAHPEPNAYGQVIGKVIDTTA